VYLAPAAFHEKLKQVQLGGEGGEGGEGSAVLIDVRLCIAPASMRTPPSPLAPRRGWRGRRCSCVRFA